MFGVLIDKSSDKGSRRAPTLEELYDTYAAALLRHCLRVLGDRTDAEDALQETFFNAYRGLSSFRNTSGYAAWLYRIATNVCLTFLRRKYRKDSRLKEISVPEAGRSGDPVQLVTVRQVLSRIVDILDERDFAIVVEHYIAGMDQGQIAQSLGISRRAVAKRLKKLRDRLEPFRS